jgi:hypothetical protein
MISKEKIELKDGVINIFNRFNTLDNTATIGGLRDDILRYIDSLQEELVSEDLEEAADNALNNVLNNHEIVNVRSCMEMFKYGAQWQKEHLWKPADGDDLPEIDREVVVFTQDFPNDAGIMSVAIAHRPNPDGWDGKSLSTGKVEHYTPKTYDKGGWNIPNVKWWLDVDKLPNVEDKI